MSHIDVLHDYVGDVVRHLSPELRDDVGFELRQLLTESLAEREATAGRAPDDGMVLEMLREFGAPAEAAARYQPPAAILLPAAQTRTFLRTSIIGIALQWAFTLPSAFRSGTLGGWWLSAGLGALWWPGALIMGAAAGVWLRNAGVMDTRWHPRMVDRERVDRRTTVLGLAAFAVGVTTVLALPWLVQLFPEPAAQMFAFDREFLAGRAPLVLPLWAAAVLLRLQALRAGRWSAGMRQLDVAINVAFVALLTWWTVAGNVFRIPATDDGTKAVLGLVIVIIILDFVVTFIRRRPEIRTPTFTR